MRPRFTETTSTANTAATTAVSNTPPTGDPVKVMPQTQTETVGTITQLTPPTTASAPIATVAPPVETLTKPAVNTPSIESTIEMQKGADELPPLTTGEPIVTQPATEQKTKTAAVAKKPTKSKLMVKSEDCKFKIDAGVLCEFLNKISLKGLIKDAYIEVKEKSLFCKFAEATVQYVSGFLELAGNIATEKQGKMIISDVDELIRVLKQFSNDVIITYSDGELVIKSATSKKKEVKLVGLAESYVSSLEGVFDRYFNMEEGRISKTQFTALSSFKTTVKEFKNTIEAGKAIGLPFFMFQLRTEGPRIDCAISNQQKTFEAEFDALEVKVVKDLDVAFAKGVPEVMDLLSGELIVYVGADCMVITQGTNVYMILSVKD